MTCDDFDDERDYLRAEARADRRKRAQREQDYRDTGYLGPCDQCGEDSCACDEPDERVHPDEVNWHSCPCHACIAQRILSKAERDYDRKERAD